MIKSFSRPLLIGGLMLLGYLIQEYAVFDPLKAIGSWPPTLFMAGIILVVTIAVAIFSLVMVNRAEAKNQKTMLFFWFACAAFTITWFSQPLFVLLDAIRSR
jgi:hypothetical protein